jgi:hypothetical protein
MSGRMLVCPLDEALLLGLRDQVLVVRVTSPGQVRPAADLARTHNDLRAVILDSDLPLADLPLWEDWAGIALGLQVPGLGSFATLVRQLPLLRSLDVKVFLGADDGANLRAARILASLQIPTVLILKGDLDWEGLDDLLHYALYGRIPHAPIEPFQYLLDHRQPGLRVDPRGTWFEDPARYLHLDAQGRVAATAQDLAEGRFLDWRPGEPGLDDLPAMVGHLEAWRAHFLTFGGCSGCEAWLLCQGAFAAGPGPRGPCEGVFAELLRHGEAPRREPESRRMPWPS